jgi:carboxyl-terminal processing protease
MQAFILGRVAHATSAFAGGSAEAAVNAKYKLLNLFGGVFERVRTDYVGKPNDSKLIESAIMSMLAARAGAPLQPNRPHPR